MGMIDKLGMKRIKEGKELASQMIGKQAQKALAKDFEDWLEFKKLPNTSANAVRYIKKIYFKGGPGSWRKTKKKD